MLVRICTCLILAYVVAVPSSAQMRERRLGVGGMVGKSAGATIKLYVRSPAAETEPASVGSISAIANPTAVSIDFSIQDEDSYVWTAHALVHHAIPSSPLNIYLGPGTAFGTFDSDLFWGLSSVFGAFFDKSRFEVFMQLSPRLVLVPDVRAEFGSAVGLRYYL
jgi:hypothetical protein